MAGHPAQALYLIPQRLLVVHVHTEQHTLSQLVMVKWAGTCRLFSCAVWTHQQLLAVPCCRDTGLLHLPAVVPLYLQQLLHVILHGIPHLAKHGGPDGIRAHPARHLNLQPQQDQAAATAAALAHRQLHPAVSLHGKADVHHTQGHGCLGLDESLLLLLCAILPGGCAFGYSFLSSWRPRSNSHSKPWHCQKQCASCNQQPT